MFTRRTLFKTVAAAVVAAIVPKAFLADKMPKQSAFWKSAVSKTPPLTEAMLNEHIARNFDQDWKVNVVNAAARDAGRECGQREIECFYLKGATHA